MKDYADRFDRTDWSRPGMAEFGAKLGLGPLYKPSPAVTRECPACGKNNARVREAHADTGMDEMELWCPDCRTSSSLDESKTPEISVLKKNRIKLTPEEHNEIMRRGATWHHGPHGEVTPGVWKARIGDKIWYVCNTHRAYQAKTTLDAAIKAFDFVKSTA